MSSDGIDRFRRRHDIQTNVKKDQSLSFLNDSPSKTTVVLQKNDFTIDALVISSYKEGPNELLLFTYVNEQDESLPVIEQRNVFLGDYVTYNDKTYLVFDDYDHADFANYKKHKILECNVMYGYNNKKFSAFYMGSRRKLETLNEGSLANSITLAQVGDSPLLIAGSQSDLKPRRRVMINGEAWMIDNIDRNTIGGIMFLSIHLDSITDADNVAESIANTPDAPVIDEGIWIAGSEQIIDTNFGYIRFNSDVTIISQTADEVRIIVPYDINSLTISTKDTLGNIVTETVEVA